MLPHGLAHLPSFGAIYIAFAGSFLSQASEHFVLVYRHELINKTQFHGPVLAVGPVQMDSENFVNLQVSS